MILRKRRLKPGGQAPRNSAHAYFRNLVGWWMLDEGAGTTTYDLSRYKANGTLDGPTWRVGELGRGPSFDGSNDVIVVSDADHLDGFPTMTLSVWATLAAQPANNHEHVLAAKSRSGGSRSYMMLYRGGASEHELQFYVSNNGAAKDGFTFVYDWPAGATRCITMTYDGATLRGYIDGHQIGSGAVTGDIASQSADLVFGSWENTPVNDFWDGMIHDVRLWSRPLGAREVKRLYTDPYAPFEVRLGFLRGLEAEAAGSGPESGMFLVM